MSKTITVLKKLINATEGFYFFVAFFLYLLVILIDSYSDHGCGLPLTSDVEIIKMCTRMKDVWTKHSSAI